MPRGRKKKVIIEGEVPPIVPIKKEKPPKQ